MLANSWSRRPKPVLASRACRAVCQVTSSQCRAVLRSWNNGRRSFSNGTALASVSLQNRLVPSRNVPNEDSLLYRARSVPYSSGASQSKYTAIKDDSHPSLFYHLFDDDEVFQPVFSLSFLEDRPRSARSQIVLGWLRAVSSAEAESGDKGSGFNDFVPNENFMVLLHKTVKEGLVEDKIWTNGAIQTQSGWMHIFDQRKPPPLGRIPDPDDILASVRVEDGHMLIDTYEPMPSYRLCTTDGVCQLTDTLMDRLKNELKRIAEGAWKNS